MKAEERRVLGGHQGGAEVGETQDAIGEFGGVKPAFKAGQRRRS